MCTTTTCAEIFSSGCLPRVRSRNTGRRQGAGSTSTERGSFNTKPRDVTTSRWRQLRTKLLHRSRSGRQNRSGETSLEQHSQTSDTPESRSILEGQLRECYGRVVYSHKTHEKCADILLQRLATIKMWQIVLSAMTTGGFIATVLGA